MKIKFSILLGVLLSISPTINAFEAEKPQEPELTTIEILENGESFSIEITAINCFNGNRQTVTVSRDQNVYTVHLKDQIKILSDEDFNTFKNFELQLRKLKMGGCSTVDTYIISFRNQKWKTSDGTCSWNGGRKLLKVFA